MSENLTQLACKVDFGATDGEDLTTDDKNENEEDDEKPFQQPHWPFEGVRNKIRYDKFLVRFRSDYNVLHICS